MEWQGPHFGKEGVWSVHTITPYEKEWLFVLSCINASSSSIPNFYIFKGMSFRHNFIIKCKERACMAMQNNGLDDMNTIQQVD